MGKVCGSESPTYRIMLICSLPTDRRYLAKLINQGIIKACDHFRKKKWLKNVASAWQ